MRPERRKPSLPLALLVGAILVGLQSLGGLLSEPSAAAAESSPYGSCEAPTSKVTVGAVTCRRQNSRALGGVTAFSYFVPPACAPSRGSRCPTLYLLHGFGGDYASMLGTAKNPSAWVSALTSRTPTPPEDNPSPWLEADPKKWKATTSLDLILIAPDGRTVPGGYGPAPLLESFWTDWNPRYARGGPDERYATPAPRFSDYLHNELVPTVERDLKAGVGRDYRAIAGTSLGGYGSYALGLTHPDAWGSIGAVSGIMNILLAHAIDPDTPNVPVGGIQPPVGLPTIPVPGPAGASAPLSLFPTQAQGFAAATFAFGDPAGDGAYYRGRMPVDLAQNARAYRNSKQAVTIRGFSNDAVPRQPSDLTNFPGILVAQGFEDLVLVTNTELNQSFTNLGVEQHYELHPGIHDNDYWNAWLRPQIEAQYAKLRHRDGKGSPDPAPDTFDYRSSEARFDIWGWKVKLTRPTTEFLNLTAVSCKGLTVRGTGTLTITVPKNCATGYQGKQTFTLDLGPTQITDAQGGTDASSAIGQTTTVALTTIKQ